MVSKPTQAKYLKSAYNSKKKKNTKAKQNKKQKNKTKQENKKMSRHPRNVKRSHFKLWLCVGHQGNVQRFCHPFKFKYIFD